MIPTWNLASSLLGSVMTVRNNNHMQKLRTLAYQQTNLEVAMSSLLIDKTWLLT